MPQGLSFGSAQLPQVAQIDPAVAEAIAKAQQSVNSPYTEEQGFWKQFLGGLKESATGAGARREANLEARNRAELTGYTGRNTAVNEGNLAVSQRRQGLDETQDTRAAAELTRINGLRSMMPQGAQILSQFNPSQLRPVDMMSAGDLTARSTAEGAATGAGNLAQWQGGDQQVEAGQYGKDSPRVTGRLAEIQAQGDQSARAASIRQPSSELTPDSIDLVATQYRILGPSGMPSRFGEDARTQIVNRAAEQLKAIGRTPAESVQKQFAMKADAASLNRVAVMGQTARAFENKALAQADLVGRLSTQVGRTDWPVLNQAILAGKIATGDTPAQLLVNSVLTFSNEYAKIMEGSTGSVQAVTESARKTADRIVHASLNPKQLQATLDQMKWEMAQTIQGYDVVGESIQRNMMGTIGGGQPQAQPGVGDVAGSTAGPSIGERRTINGQLAEWDGKGWKAVK